MVDRYGNIMGDRQLRRRPQPTIEDEQLVRHINIMMLVIVPPDKIALQQLLMQLSQGKAKITATFPIGPPCQRLTMAAGFGLIPVAVQETPIDAVFLAWGYGSIAFITPMRFAGGGEIDAGQGWILKIAVTHDSSPVFQENLQSFST
jgi:hypothetical protein